MKLRDNADVRRLLRDLHDRLSGIGPECAEVRALLATPSPETGAPTMDPYEKAERDGMWPTAGPPAAEPGKPATCGALSNDGVACVREPHPDDQDWHENPSGWVWYSRATPGKGRP